jgi:hypothetical protein
VDERRFPYDPVLAFLRTRLLGAVLMPALLGSAASAGAGELPILRFVLVLVGLAAAEFLNLLASDYAAWRSPGGSESVGLSVLPGNPVIPSSRLNPERIPLVLLPIAVVGLAVLLYFTLVVGIEVLVFFVAAAAIGGLYVFSPFPYAFLSTSLIPPLISGGTYLALTGELEARAFWVGVPIAWISVAVILGYRVLFAGTGREGGPENSDPAGAWRRREGIILAVYALAGVTLVVWVPAGILPVAALLALVPWAGCLVWILLLLRKPWSNAVRRSARVPVTTVGVLMHILSSAVLALALWLG